jgi:hypothetical protein
LVKNTDKTIDDAVKKPYIDILRTVTVEGADITIAPEIPEVPIYPMAYPGPSHFAGTGTQSESSFKVVGGMGLATLGRLGFAGVGGNGHAFGVMGQGNEAKDLPSSDTAMNLVLKPQTTEDAAKCLKSYLYVTVTGTDAQTVNGGELPLTFEAKAWGVNPYLLAARPAESELKPIDRESAKFLAAGIATVAMVAASLY